MDRDCNSNSNSNRKTFTTGAQLEYRESLVENRTIMKYYELDNPGVAFHMIPDACMDIQFVRENDRLVPYACGSFLESADSPTGQCSYCFGIKFNPGMLPACMRFIAADLICNRKRMDECQWLWELGDKLRKAASFEAKIRLFEAEFPFEEQFAKENCFVSYAMKRIREENGSLNIAALSSEIGYSQKYLDRIFRAETGLTMKKYATIIRIQAAIRYLQEDRWDEVYEILGYYDQSHFIKDFKRYTCMTPRQFCRVNQKMIV